MRQFKFRAWDKENEVMIYPKGILFDGRVVNFSCGILEPFEGCELMQFTGLYDSNGKEIYEGDIAKVNWPKDEDIGVVKYLIDGFFIADMKWHSPTTVANFGIEVEVIGNIYENPELLKEESK